MKTDYSNQKEHRQHKQQQNKITREQKWRGGNPNCMDTSSDKQVKFHTRKLGDG